MVPEGHGSTLGNQHRVLPTWNLGVCVCVCVGGGGGGGRCKQTSSKYISKYITIVR